MAGIREIKYPGQTKTSAAALQFDTGVSRARGRKPSPKITWSSRLGVSAAALLIGKRNLLKKPIVRIFQCKIKKARMFSNRSCLDSFEMAFSYA